MTMLRSIREKKGLTVSQLAARASIPTRVIAEYEEGRQAMPLNHARLIAKALWVPIEDLMPPAGSVLPAPPTTPPGAPAQAAPLPATYTAAPAMAPAPTGTQAPYVPTPATTTQPYQDQRPTRQDAPRTTRTGSSEGKAGPGGSRGPRSTPHPPGPISEGQLQELARLAVRLEIDQEQMESRIGKSLSALDRPGAKEWIKKLRAIADEIAPTQKVRFGMWPEGQEDREAVYLREQRDAQSYLTFKLFNGEQIGGVVSDFTPYTITIKQSNQGEDEVVLRKLAIAYYRRSESANQPATEGEKEATNTQEAVSMKDESSASNAEDANTTYAPGTQDVGMSDNALTVEALDEEEALEADTSTNSHDHVRDDHHQPLDKGIDSDHVGRPDVPERDNMDEDRGA